MLAIVDPIVNNHSRDECDNESCNRCALTASSSRSLCALLFFEITPWVRFRSSFLDLRLWALLVKTHPRIRSSCARYTCSRVPPASLTA